MSMNLKQELQNALTTAMKARDEDTKRVLRLVMTSIKLAEVEKSGEVDDTYILGVLQKEIKTRNEMIEEAKSADRADLLEAAKRDITILNRFLPQQMSAEKLEKMAKDVIQELGATHIREMGQVMKILMPKVAGRASGNDVSKIVKDLLNN